MGLMCDTFVSCPQLCLICGDSIRFGGAGGGAGEDDALCMVMCSRTPFIRMLVIRISNCPDRLGPSGKIVENCIKLTCLAVTGYLITYSTVLWLVELQIRRGVKI
jgi:hypothetical protein